MTATKGTDFEDYGLKVELLQAIVEKGWDKPSPVQEGTIPITIAGNNQMAWSLLNAAASDSYHG